MSTIHLKLIISAIVLTVSACAPVDEETASGSITETQAQNNDTTASVEDRVINNTRELVANPDFDFRADRDLEISFTQFPSEIGKFNVYHAYEHFDPATKTYYPDHTSRIASYVATPDIKYTLQTLKEWNYLIFEWLPMDGKSNESYMLVALSDNTQYELVF